MHFMKKSYQLHCQVTPHQPPSLTLLWLFLPHHTRTLPCTDSHPLVHMYRQYTFIGNAIHTPPSVGHYRPFQGAASQCTTPRATSQRSTITPGSMPSYQPPESPARPMLIPESQSLSSPAPPHTQIVDVYDHQHQSGSTIPSSPVPQCPTLTLTPTPVSHILI
jgi:hypothetical protein